MPVQKGSNVTERGDWDSAFYSPPPVFLEGGVAIPSEPLLPR